MIPSVPCKVCAEGGHRSRDCPQLSAPLRGGFSHENGTSGVDPDGGEDDAVRTLSSAEPQKAMCSAIFSRIAFNAVSYVSNSRLDAVNRRIVSAEAII